MLEQEVVVGVLLDVEFAHFVVEHLLEGLDVGLLLSGDEEALASEFRHPRVDEFVERDIATRGWCQVVGILLSAPRSRDD